MGAVQQQQLKASAANSQRVEFAAQRLAGHILQPDRQNVKDFFSLCLNLSRGIDYAIANNEVPPKAQTLPSLLRKICQRKNDLVLQAAIMVLMFSVKSACRADWFSFEEAQELLALADEIGTGFSGPSISNNLFCLVSTIMTRFYPLMKMGRILASLEVEPGYGAFMTDFHISKSMINSTQDKIRLFVAQTDKIETSACIISPQHVNFILNGKGVDRRNNVFMEVGPQMPTNVSPMLKYGTNLIQAVGQFTGQYIIIVAVISMASSLESPQLQDYVQSGTPLLDSDSDLIEGPSRISLNCPISRTRIKTPVKGHMCKHHQCFDFSNFVHINSRRPAWRCPHCNQHVCYTDIRVDQNMVKVLKEVGENIAHVIISADGSWKAITEGDDNVVQAHKNVLNCEKEGCEQQHSITNSDPVILDLTNNDNEIDASSTGGIEDVKPNLQSGLVTTNLSMLSELNSTVEASQHLVATDDEFWSRILYPDGSSSSGARSDAQTVGSFSAPTSASLMAFPVLTDAISPALNREGDAAGCTHMATPVIQSLYSAPCNPQLQQSEVNASVNYEYGRALLNRHLNRTPIAPIAVQTPPAASSHGFNDMEQQQRFSISCMNTLLGSDMASSPLQHHSAAQASAHQTSNALSGGYSVSSGLSTESQNLQQQRQALNLRMPQLMSQSPSMTQSSSPHSRTPTHQGSAPVGPVRTTGNASHQHARFMVAQSAARTQITRQLPTVPVQIQTPNAGPRYPMTAGGVRASVGDQRENMAGSLRAFREENMTDLPSAQNWTPAGRMRGSLSGRACEDLNHMVIRPTYPPTQQARPHLSPAPHLSVPRPPNVPAFTGNSNTRLLQSQTSPLTDPGSGGSGTVADHGMSIDM